MLSRVMIKFYLVMLEGFNRMEFSYSSKEEGKSRSQRDFVKEISHMILVHFSTEFFDLLDELRPMGVVAFFLSMLAEHYKWITFKESLNYFNACETILPMSILKYSLIIIEDLKSSKKIPDNAFVNFLLKWLNIEKEFNIFGTTKV
jgi:hypothetical protein